MLRIIFSTKKYTPMIKPAKIAITELRIIRNENVQHKICVMQKRIYSSFDSIIPVKLQKKKEKQTRRIK